MFFSLVLLFFAFLLCFKVRPSFADDAIEGDVLVILKEPDDVTSIKSRWMKRERRRDEADEIASKFGIKTERHYDFLSDKGNGIFAQFHSDKKSNKEMIEKLSKRPDVLSVCPNYKISIKLTPNDYLQSLQWGLRAINATSAWNTTIGSKDVRVAIMDTGILTTHEDLIDNIDTAFCKNFVSETSNPTNSYEDGHGHGTHVAGIIGAKGNNLKGITGINWDVKLIAYRVMDNSGTGNTAILVNAVNELINVLNNNPNLKIPAVNLSLSYYSDYTPFQLKRRDVLYNALQQLSEMNRTVICVAASNESIELGTKTKDGYCYPGSYDDIKNMVVVGACKSETEFDTSYSNYSSTYVDIVAPGTEIKSTFNKTNSSYKSSDGTSMASPHVAGAVALLKSAYPDANASQLKAGVVNSTQNNLSFATYAKNGLLDLKGAMDIMKDAPVLKDTLALGFNQNNYNDSLLDSSSPVTENLTYSVTKGSLPDGLSMSDDGIISGKPTTNGIYNFTVTVTSMYRTVTKEMTISVEDMGIIPTITTKKVYLGLVGSQYTYTLSADGDTPLTWSFVSGNLPDGITLSNSGVLSGIPTEEKIFTFTVKCANKYGFDTREYSLQIISREHAIAPQFTTTKLMGGKVGSPYTVQLEATGTEGISFALSSGELPKGLSLDSSGLISGTAKKSGTYMFDVNISNIAGDITKSLKIHISPVLMLCDEIV